MSILMSLVGIVTLFALAVLLSDNRKKINYRTVSLAFLTQTAIAGLILYVPQGGQLLGGVVNAVQHVIDYGNDGIMFVFGEVASRNRGITIAFHVLPVIVFFSALMSTLYYLHIMQKVISIFGGWLHKLLQTSRTESMSAVANVFIGHTEAPLVVRPYLANMTQSELFAVMTGGCATIAGAVMAGYAAMGIDLKYLITASFMAAPGGLLMAKIIKPETDYRDPDVDHAEYGGTVHPVNIFEAIANGAADGLKLALNVGAMLLAFVAMIALLNGMLSGLGGLFGYPELTLQGMLGVVFAPLAFLLSVPWAEANAAGSLIGQKLVVNEFVAYVSFVDIRESLSEHTQVVVTFALCGFANLSTIAILLGGLGTLVPERRQDVANMGLKAVLGGTLSNLMSAVLAGLFLSIPA
jgi:CNT family concentrative nucleoside transporter